MASHSPLPWSYDGYDYYADNGGRFREVVAANGERVIGEFGSVSHGDALLMVAATRAYHLLAGGWSVEKVSLYDEEGVDGWRWVNGDREFTVVGDWNDLPPIPDELA